MSKSTKETLADLIPECDDSAATLEKAVRRVKNLKLKEMLKEFGLERRHIVADLRNESRALTGSAAEGGTFAGGLSRFLSDLKDEVTGSDDREVLEDVLESEEDVLAAFEKALREPEEDGGESDGEGERLSEETRSHLRDQEARIAAAKARVESALAALKEEAEGERKKDQEEPES